MLWPSLPQLLSLCCIAPGDRLHRCWGSLGTAEEPLPLLRQGWGWGLGRNWAALPQLWAQRGRRVLQWCSVCGAPGPGLPWDGSEEPWPVWGGDPSPSGAGGWCVQPWVCLGCLGGEGVHFSPACLLYPAPSWLGPLLGPGTTLWSFFFTWALGGQRTLCRGCEEGSLGLC